MRDILLKIILSVSVLTNIAALLIFLYLGQTINFVPRVLNYLNINKLGLFLCEQDFLVYYPLNTPGIRVHGLPGFVPDYPEFDRLINNNIVFREGLYRISRYPAGVRIRFLTDSRLLAIDESGLVPTGPSYPSLSENGSSGIDVYANGVYVKTLNSGDCGETVQLRNTTDNTLETLVEIYLPAFSKVNISAIGVVKGSSIRQAHDYNTVIAFYGTSITQGEGAPRPSLSYPALVSRMLNSDYYNLGFSGNANGDAEIATLIAGLDVDLIFLEYSRQATVVNGSLGGNLGRFYKIIREEKPITPIVVTTPIFDVSELAGNEDLEMRRREFFSEFTELVRQDDNIYFIDGQSLLGPSDGDGLSDGTHPNALGASLIAKRIEPLLNSLINHVPDS